VNNAQPSQTKEIVVAPTCTTELVSDSLRRCASSVFDSSDQTSAGQYGFVSTDSTAAFEDSRRFSDNDGIKALYQSIIAPVLAAVIGFDYG
jgi:hypothetical protein